MVWTHKIRSDVDGAANKPCSVLQYVSAHRLSGEVLWNRSRSFRTRDPVRLQNDAVYGASAAGGQLAAGSTVLESNEE